jgi:hypothetical protein
MHAIQYTTNVNTRRGEIKQQKHSKRKQIEQRTTQTTTNSRDIIRNNVSHPSKIIQSKQHDSIPIFAECNKYNNSKQQLPNKTKQNITCPPPVKHLNRH